MAVIGRQALTAVLPVRAGREAALEAALVKLGPSLTERLSTALTLHFARVVVLPGEPADGHATSASLLVETTYDGAFGPHVEELFAVAGTELGALFAECDGVETGAGIAAFAQTLRRASRPARAFAAAHGELGVAEIRRDAALRERVVALLERERPTLAGLRPLAILVALRRELGLSTYGQSVGASSKPVRRAREDGLLWLVALLPLLVGMLMQDVRERLLGLWHDRSDARAARYSAPASPAPRARSAQRAFTHLVPVRPGRFRRSALRRALAVAASALGADLDERAPGIHALRFVLLDDGRLLFTEQQDGSLASRLSALGRQAKALAGLVWSSTDGFPRALLRHLFGRSDDERWLEWLRAHEVKSGFCYSAYPELAARDIAENSELHALLAAEPTDARARRLLELV